MNDPMHDPFDRELDQLLGRAFAARPDGPVSTPSMLDVRHRARLRHRRRIGAMVGSVAVVGVGGAAVLAKAGDDGQDRVATPGADTPSTIAVPTTTAQCVPVTTVIVTETTSVEFATTTITDADGNAAQPTSTVGFVPGTEEADFAVTTTLPPGWEQSWPADAGCQPGSIVWMCTGDLGPDGNGGELYADCRQGWWGTRLPLITDTTVVPCGPNDDCDPAKVETTVPTTTSATCPPSADCTAPTTTGRINGGTSIGTYVVQQGDTPASVSLRFDLTVDELNAANVNTAGYAAFFVGLEIRIPGSTGGVTSIFDPNVTTTAAGG